MFFSLRRLRIILQGWHVCEEEASRGNFNEVDQSKELSRRAKRYALPTLSPRIADVGGGDDAPAAQWYKWLVNTTHDMQQIRSAFLSISVVLRFFSSPRNLPSSSSRLLEGILWNNRYLCWKCLFMYDSPQNNQLLDSLESRESSENAILWTRFLSAFNALPVA